MTLKSFFGVGIRFKELMWLYCANQDRKANLIAYVKAVD